MRKILAKLLACASLIGGTALVGAEEKKTDASDRAQVTKFLKEHVMDRTVASPKTTYKVYDNQMESDYEDQTTFNNFSETAQGFTFDITMVSKETRYELDKDGKRIQPGRDLSGIEVYRYEIVERASTKKLTGTVRILSMTTRAPSREGAAILVTGMKLADGKVSWNETLPGYLDLVAARGKYRPGSWDSKSTFSVAGGKLQVEYDVTDYDVDPDTLKRTPTKAKQPPSVAKEIEQKPGR
jgi:hypothetical protein